MLKSLVTAISEIAIFDDVAVEKLPEASIASSMYEPLLSCVAKISKESFPRRDGTRRTDAKTKSVIWNTAIDTTIQSVGFLGSHHRPDYLIKFPNMSIAIELKKGNSSQAIRQGISQALFYTTAYDFALCIITDCRAGTIAQSLIREREKEFLNSVWVGHNVKLVVVPNHLPTEGDI